MQKRREIAEKSSGTERRTYVSAEDKGSLAWSAYGRTVNRRADLGRAEGQIADVRDERDEHLSESQAAKAGGCAKCGDAHSCGVVCGSELQLRQAIHHTSQLNAQLSQCTATLTHAHSGRTPDPQWMT